MQDDQDTNTLPTADQKRRGRRPGCQTRASKVGHVIEIDGDELVPRDDEAATLRMCSRSLRRLNPPTTYIGGVAYVKRRATRKLLADRASKPKRKHRRTRG